MSKALLITGATGKQGGSVINALLKANADLEILALTRDAQSASAQKLQSRSPKIKLITGDLDAVDDVFQKAKQASKLPIWGVFSVQWLHKVAIGNGASPQTEERQGKALIDASIKNGVKHFVYSSVDRGGPRSDNDATPVPHFASKHRIEQYLFSKVTESNSEMAWTILRPVAFFENLVPGFLGKVFSTSWEMTLKKEQTLQLVAISDIGFFAAEAFAKPDEYKGRKISLAGDELTYTQFKTIFAEKTGQSLPTTFRFLAGAINTMIKDLGYMFKWFRDVGFGVDIPVLKQMNPELKDFATWLETESQFETR
ncbi:NAD(P)-binding protein [Macroventuria anomochaeta]|uniref:NAD(P)-binding protein n=1 Tax=Macroventuria anomochaeta TaxID=301207 RepID=A0ACB6RGV5_9PLEO|nr:NAD(P)-binding protein [Macroventuria anomochaeta]KAF2621121.1 NAD(P)-binding protein [Macroventuria anomochaeta]